jgi:hypothetical protein
MAQADGDEKAGFYQREAAECRKRANDAQDRLDRHGCLCLARHYERQARLIEIETLKQASPNITPMQPHPQG